MVVFVKTIGYDYTGQTVSLSISQDSQVFFIFLIKIIKMLSLKLT